jgi:hypothetical protein
MNFPVRRSSACFYGSKGFEDCELFGVTFTFELLRRSSRE